MIYVQNCQNTNTEIFDWISKNIIIEPFEKVGNPIRRFIPPYFESYCKILHPFTMDIDAPNTKYSEKEEEREEELLLIKRMYDKLNLEDINLLNLDLKSFLETATELVLKKHEQERSILELPFMDMPNGQFKKDMRVLLKEPFKDVFTKFGKLFESAFNGTKSNKHPIHDREFDKIQNKRKVSWKEIANTYDLRFHDNISPISFSKKFENIGFPLNLYFPNCSLDREDCDKLLKALKEFSKEQKVFINSYSDNYDIINQICPIEKMINENKDDALNGGYIVDSNQEWMIYADYHRDLQMTILGGSKILIDTLKNETGLEIVECSEFSRVDHYSDTLN